MVDWHLTGPVHLLVGQNSTVSQFTAYSPRSFFFNFFCFNENSSFRFFMMRSFFLSIFDHTALIACSSLFSKTTRKSLKIDPLILQLHSLPRVIQKLIKFIYTINMFISLFTKSILVAKGLKKLRQLHQHAIILLRNGQNMTFMINMSCSRLIVI